MNPSRLIIVCQTTLPTRVTPPPASSPSVGRAWTAAYETDPLPNRLNPQEILKPNDVHGPYAWAADAETIEAGSERLLSLPGGA
jgi:hypothetical protein